MTMTTLLHAPVAPPAVGTPQAALSPVLAGEPLAAAVTRAADAVQIVHDRRRQEELAAAQRRATAD